jgi:hypothetical protein
MSATRSHDACAGLRALGSLATWSVSSHKYGYGVENLRDPDEDVFWQSVPLLRAVAMRSFGRQLNGAARCSVRRSEGPQPHSISLQFPHLVPIVVRRRRVPSLALRP